MTVGTHDQGFERLVKEMDAIAGELEEEVVIQTGNTAYETKNVRQIKFVDRKGMEELNARARIVIAHAGAGSIIFALKQKKPLILVPRLKKFGEHVNDHQLELARELENEGRALCVSDIRELRERIMMAGTFQPRTHARAPMLDVIREYLRELDEARMEK